GGRDGVRAVANDAGMGADRGGHGVDHLAETALEGAEQRRGWTLRPRLRAGGEHAASEAAVLLRQLDKPGEDGFDAELSRIAAVDAGEERLGEVVDGLLTVVLADEVGDRFVLGA